MSWLAGSMLALAALTLGRSLQVNNGFLHPDALWWLLLASALTLGAVATSGRQWDARAYGRRLLTTLLLGGVLLQIVQLLVDRPLTHSSLPRGADDTLVLTCTLLLGGLAAVIAIGGKRVRCAAFAAFIVCHGALGLWVVRASPDPHIDVVTVHRRAIAKLAAGRTPYTLSFRNIYGTTQFYGEGMTSGDRVLFGLPYPPLTLAFTAPGDLIFGDFRIGHVLALLAAAALIGSMGWTAHAMLAAALLLTTPRVLYVLEHGWTEPSAVVMLALTAAMLWRGAKGAPIALGLMFAAKQYLVVSAALLPLIRFARPLTPRRALLMAFAAGAAVTLPFFFWDPRGFITSVVLLQLREPFRLDSLSLLAWLARAGYSVPTVAVTLAAAIVAAGVALWRLPRSTGGFAAGVTLVTLVLFLFGKKAFCNYYFFVLGAMAVAIAASGEDTEVSDER